MGVQEAVGSMNYVMPVIRNRSSVLRMKTLGALVMVIYPILMLILVYRVIQVI
jgi:hypothetical protein